MDTIHLLSGEPAPVVPGPGAVGRVHTNRVGTCEGRLTGGGRRRGRECRFSYRARRSACGRRYAAFGGGDGRGPCGLCGSTRTGRSPSPVPKSERRGRTSLIRSGVLCACGTRGTAAVRQQWSGGGEGPGLVPPPSCALFPCAVAAEEGEGDGGAERATAPGSSIEHVGSGCAVAE
jgi:hypothetical protein